jgi:2',3'-cyclic-nucleotide 2'-phosphodiesterase (5'-nucleotidase family)
MIFRLSLSLLLAVGCSTPLSASATSPKKLSFLLTNDLHGSLEPLARLSTLAKNVRAETDSSGGSSALFILDSGDQFQGTLISNYDEGESLFRAMNAIGYDAAVPGNHDYDFGPLGWLYDKVSPGNTGNNPREVIEKLSGIARFPLLSANTYLKSSIRSGGREIPLDSQCRPANQTPVHELDFGRAERPAFLKPYVILEKSGVRVALIGLDHPATASMTTLENVSDLCFRDVLESYLEIRESLEGQADVFVLMIHQGNAKNSKEASELAEAIEARRAGGVHLVAAGHTHFVHDDLAGGVHVVQDGANGKAYGRVDLYFDPEARTVLPSETRASAGVSISDQTAPDPEVDEIVARARNQVAPLAGRLLGKLDTQTQGNRISESALGNILSDALKEALGTDLALMNTGGIRAPLPAGEVRYEDLFRVLPFQNQAVSVRKMPWSILKSALQTAIQTCGRYGTLALSGIRVRFTRNCGSGPQARDLDPEARLVRVETVSGKVLYDSATGVEVATGETLSLATLDFLAAGGSGYKMLAGVEVDSTPGIHRELIVEALVKNPALFRTGIDGRFKNDSGQ